MEPRTFIIDDFTRGRAIGFIGGAPVGWSVTIKPTSRTLDQNAKLWPMLQDVASQVEWHGVKLSKEDWKDMFTASLRRSRVVPGLDGGFVVLGLSTSNMGKREFSDLVELIYAFGSERGVRWSEPNPYEVTA